MPESFIKNKVKKVFSLIRNKTWYPSYSLDLLKRTNKFGFVFSKTLNCFSSVHVSKLLASLLAARAKSSVNRMLKKVANTFSFILFSWIYFLKLKLKINISFLKRPLIFFLQIQRKLNKEIRFLFWKKLFVFILGRKESERKAWRSTLSTNR